MPTVISGTDGVSQVQAGAVESGDLAAGAIGSGDLPAGSVIQVVQQEFETVIAYSNTDNTTTTPDLDIFSASITPSDSNNKVLVLAKGTAGGGDINNEFSFALKRNGSLIGGNSDPSNLWAGQNVIASSFPPSEGGNTVTFNYLDEPNSASSVSYTLSFYAGEQNTYYINRGNGANSTRNWANSGNCSLILMEIAG